MDEFSDIWIEQCEATRDIRAAWGTRKALGYLVGEKLLNYIRAADSDPSWAANVPLFAAEIGDLHDRGTPHILRNHHPGRAGRPCRYRGTVSDDARRRRVR